MRTVEFLTSLAAAIVIVAASHCHALAAEPDGAAGPITDAERSAYLAELHPLQEQLAAMRNEPGISQDRWADAQVFIKGVVWALDFGPIADPRGRGLVWFGLDRARERVDSLAAGEHPWAKRRGRSVRGFISAVDGSVQPYCLVVPEDYNPDKPIRLDVVLHGSTPATGIGELLFIEAADAAGSPAVPSQPFIEVHPMGRLGENAYRFEGETDVYEAIESVCRDYNIDRSRIVLRGSSLGGVGTWQLGLKRPDRWAAIGPAAGPVDTRVFAASPWEHFVRLEQLTSWQEIMLHIVDAVDYATNANMVPVVAAMGDKDPYYSSHVLVEEAFAKERVPLVGLVDHGAGHSITPAVMQKQLDLLGNYAVRGIDPFPKHIRFVTWTLKYSRCHWIEMLGLAQHYQRAEIEAHIDGTGAITLAEPRNITRFALHQPAVSGDRNSVTVAGTKIDLPKSDIDGRSLAFEKRNGRWTCLGSLDALSLSGKRPGLQGPIDDAFAQSFLCVRGTGTAWNPSVVAWADANLRRFADEWRRHYHGFLPIKDDIEVTDDDMRRSNLILFGDPGNNLWIEKILSRLPIKWTRGTLQLGAVSHSATDHGVQLIYPNPLSGAEGRYVVLNSGHTYHDEELRFSYMVFPRLGDWAIVKVGDNSPDAPPQLVAETVVNSGFFDESWNIP